MAGGPSSSSSSTSDSQSSQSSSSSNQYSELVLNKSFLEPLDANLNHDQAKDRINLVFYYPDNINNSADLKSKILQKVLLTDTKNVYPYNYGVFNIEPFKSNINKFNFWFYKQPIPASQDYQFEYLVKDPTALGLDYVSPIRLINDGSGYYRSNADYADITYNNDFSIKKYYTSPIRLYSEENGFVLAHELGHSLFGLADEYSEPDRTTPIIKYPNCAADETTATKWWGDLVGTVDPYFYEFRTAFIDYYTSEADPFYLRYNNGVLEKSYYNDESYEINWAKVENLNEVLDEENYKVGYFPGQCFSTSQTGAIRPTKESMMNSASTPILGNVNRREMQKVFNLFSGDKNIISKQKPDYLNPNLFQSWDLSDTKCTVKVTIADQKLLTCTIKNKNPLISKTNIYKIGISRADNNENATIKDPGVQNCSLSSDGTLFTCDPINITNLGDEYYNLLFFFEPGPNSEDSEQKYPSALPVTYQNDSLYAFKLSIFPVVKEAAQSSSSVINNSSSKTSSISSSSSNSSTKTAVAVPVTSSIVGGKKVANQATNTTTSSSVSTNSSKSNSSSNSQPNSNSSNKSSSKSQSNSSNSSSQENDSTKKNTTQSKKTNFNFINPTTMVIALMICGVSGLVYFYLREKK